MLLRVGHRPKSFLLNRVGCIKMLISLLRRWAITYAERTTPAPAAAEAHMRGCWAMWELILCMVTLEDLRWCQGCVTARPVQKWLWCITGSFDLCSPGPTGMELLLSAAHSTEIDVLVGGAAWA